MHHPTPYKPTPGSTPCRVVELLRFLPEGTELHGEDLCKRLNLKRTTGLNKDLQAATKHGLLRSERRFEPCSTGVRRRTFWSAGDALRKPGEQVPVREASAMEKDALRYLWLSTAWLEGIPDDTLGGAQEAIGYAQTEEELAADIDAAIAAGNWAVRHVPRGAHV